MIDFDFYTNSYLGSAIPETAFNGVVLQATAALERLCRRYRVAQSDAVSRKMALCAMAEVIYTFSRRKPGVSAATVGKVSVRYGQSDTLQKQLLEKARIYLDFYRGAGV